MLTPASQAKTTMKQPNDIKTTARRFRLLLWCGLCLIISAFTTSAQSAGWTRQRTGTLAWLHSVFFWIRIAAGQSAVKELCSPQSMRQNRQPKSLQVLMCYATFFVDDNSWLVCEVNVYELKTKDQPSTCAQPTVANIGNV
jgi:hypothetical protein